ncbi:hypothetical protein AYI69_g2228 [Smittium culicis]|uniref:Uncharacterized protein n=1 Tax=Smittium culicis TaxID=133412 RepID=A0A1R1YN45_9FUNG|nr:hypothetical protein AYI69_g2228 [Smittium culicis]
MQLHAIQNLFFYTLSIIKINPLLQSRLNSHPNYAPNPLIRILYYPTQPYIHIPNNTPIHLSTIPIALDSN